MKKPLEDLKSDIGYAIEKIKSYSGNVYILYSNISCLSKKIKKDIEETEKKTIDIAECITEIIDKELVNNKCEDKNIENILNSTSNFKNKLSEYFSEVTNYLLGEGVPRDVRSINLNVFYERATYKVFSQDLPFEDQISEESFNGYGFQLSYGHNINSIRTLITLGCGIKRDNNADDTVKVNEITLFTDSSNMSREVTKEITAVKGPFQMFNTKSIYLSAYSKPFINWPFRICAYARYNNNTLKQPIVFGIGTFQVDKENSFKPIAGIIFEYEKDLKRGAEIIPLEKRFKINLVLSLPFKIEPLLY